MDFQDSGDQDSQVPTCEYPGRLITPRSHLRQESIASCLNWKQKNWNAVLNQPPKTQGRLYNMIRKEASDVSNVAQDTDENPFY